MAPSHPARIGSGSASRPRRTAADPSRWGPTRTRARRRGVRTVAPQCSIIVRRVTAIELPLIRRQIHRRFLGGRRLRRDVFGDESGDRRRGRRRAAHGSCRDATRARGGERARVETAHGEDRARILRRLADLMLEHEDDLARLMVVEQGKPLAEAKVEVAYAASFYEWFGEEAKRVYGDTIPTPWPDKRIHVTKEPVGVTARHHALELPRSDADPQVGACARGRMHDGAQAGRADAALGAGSRGARRRPASCRRLLRRHRRSGGARPPSAAR